MNISNGVSIESFINYNITQKGEAALKNIHFFDADGKKVHVNKVLIEDGVIKGAYLVNEHGKIDKPVSTFDPDHAYHGVSYRKYIQQRLVRLIEQGVPIAYVRLCSGSTNFLTKAASDFMPQVQAA